MWKINKIKAENLMSFKEFEFTPESGVTVIYGNNKDNDSQNSNGSGKSAILEAIAIGITGVPLRKIKNGESVRNDEKSCTIELELHNSFSDEIMSIERILYPKKSALVNVKINGELYTNLTTADDTNAFIEDKIGVCREDLYNYFILSSSRFEPFLNASDTKKKEVINRFSSGDQVDKAIELADQDLADASGEMQVLQAQFNVLNGKIIGTQDSIDDAELGDGNKAEQAAERKLKVTALQNEIKEAEKGSKEADAELKELNSGLKAATDQLAGFDETECDAIKLAISQFDKSIRELQAKETKLNDDNGLLRRFIRKTETALAGLIECPKCEHEFDPAAKDFDADNARKEIKDSQNLIEENQELLDELAVEINDVDGKKYAKNQELQKFYKQKEVLEDQLRSVKKEIRELTLEIDTNKNRITSLRGRIQNLEEEKEDNSAEIVARLREKLAKLKEEARPLEAKLKNVEAEISDYTVQKDIFKRFKTHLANKSIMSLEMLANEYLEAIGSDINISLTGFTKLSSGQVRDKIDAVLIRDGEEIGSFNKNSNGEKARINLAMILTMNKMINLNAGEGRGLNLLIIDEILDSSDTSGLMNMIQALNKLEMNVLLVSHVALAENYGNTMTVVKEGGVSSLIAA